jgi:hypothetical protein
MNQLHRLAYSLSLAAALAFPGNSRCGIAYAEPREPGLSELVILDPGADDRGLPGVNPVNTIDGVEIDIPPTIHVHRYYYSGNKEYQGPIIDGGPTVVVANSPFSGERMYIDVMLPAGAPVIAYDKLSITYVYPNRRVCIAFDPLLHDKVHVTYLPGQGIARTVRDKHEVLRANTKTAIKQSALLNACHDLADDSVKIVKGAAGVVGTAATIAVDTTRKVVNIIPGVQTLKSMGEQHRERGYTEGLRQAGEDLQRRETEYVSTIR